LANLRIFISSTCYDLSVIRGQLRLFVEALGHEPVMSDYNDVLYDPRIHTHSSCIDEVANADAAIVLIGSRFGGQVVPQALQKVDLDSLESVSKSHDILKTRENISITQLEILKAIERSIPVFAFIDERVMHDHGTYERNKGKEFASKIEYTSIEKPETAVFIFEFINFLRHRTINNAITTFSRFQDIEESLRRQWSGLLQRLLFEQRSREIDSRRIDALTEQFEDLKAAILTAVGGNKNDKEIARGVVRFRKLLDFVRAFNLPDYSFLTGSSVPWTEFLNRIGVTEVVPTPPVLVQQERSVLGARRASFLFVRADGTFYELDDRMFDPAGMNAEWSAFMALGQEARAVIVDTLTEMRPLSISMRRFVRHIAMTIEEYTTAELSRMAERSVQKENA
jgi:hypothetical protein